MKILLATGNPHKAREVAPLLSGIDVELLTLADLPEIPAVVEDGATLDANARKKALEPAAASGLWTLADDTGLEVEALDGAPGVYSARYAGEGCDFAANIEKLLRELRGVPEARRGAAFRTVVALASPSGEVRCVEGRLDGRIAEAAAGGGGFGYDPLFFVPELGRTLAEISAEKKNEISHRGRAIRAIVPALRDVIAAASTA
ncbi:MAG: XTP/dITP diphosphatase [Elusimicrobiota bacterium]